MNVRQLKEEGKERERGDYQLSHLQRRESSSAIVPVFGYLPFCLSLLPPLIHKIKKRREKREEEKQ